MLCLKSNILISDLYLIILYLDNLDIAPTAGKKWVIFVLFVIE